MTQQYYHFHTSSYFAINLTVKVTYLSVEYSLMAPHLNMPYIRLLYYEVE